MHCIYQIGLKKQDLKLFLGSICSNGLLENITAFPESVFDASAARFPDFGPSSARLYSSQPWCLPPNHTDENQFLEISLTRIFSLSTVATAGGDLGYVTSYMLSYMVSGYSWKYAAVGAKQVWISYGIWIFLGKHILRRKRKSYSGSN